MKSQETGLIKVYCLGEFKIELDKKVYLSDEWNSKKALTLFKYLLARDREKAQKDLLMELLWPNSKKDQTHTLHTTVYFLRKFLANNLGKDNLIKYSKGLYWIDINDEIWIDFIEFRNIYQQAVIFHGNNELTKALKFFKDAFKMYKGEFLQEDLYEDWTLNYRQHFREIFIDLVLRYSTILVEVENDYSEAIKVCQVGLEVDRYREELYQKMIGIYLDSDLYVEAVKVYSEYKDNLQQEYGLQPSPKIKELFYEIESMSDYYLNSDTTSTVEEGPLECDRYLFKKIYELQHRRLKRTGEVFSLMYIKLNNRQIKDKDTKRIIDSLQISLRRGDIISLWSKKIILINLYRAGKNESEIIKKRILAQIPLELRSEIEAHYFPTDFNGNDNLTEKLIELDI